MYSRHAINFLNHFKCFYGIKAGFPAKTNGCTLFNCFFHYDLWHGQNRQVMSCCEYAPHCEWFELKLGMHGEEGLLANFPKFPGDCATNIMFSQHCCKSYRTDLVYTLTLHAQLCSKKFHFRCPGTHTGFYLLSIKIFTKFGKPERKFEEKLKAISNFFIFFSFSLFGPYEKCPFSSFLFGTTRGPQRIIFSYLLMLKKNSKRGLEPLLPGQRIVSNRKKCIFIYRS